MISRSWNSPLTGRVLPIGERLQTARYDYRHGVHSGHRMTGKCKQTQPLLSRLWVWLISDETCRRNRLHRKLIKLLINLNSFKEMTKNGALPSSFCQPLLLGSLCHPAQHSLFLKLKCRNICFPRPPDHTPYNLLYFKRHVMYCTVCPRPQKALSQPPSKVKLLLLLSDRVYKADYWNLAL